MFFVVCPESNACSVVKKTFESSVEAPSNCALAKPLEVSQEAQSDAVGSDTSTARVPSSCTYTSLTAGAETPARQPPLASARAVKTTAFPSADIALRSEEH